MSADLAPSVTESQVAQLLADAVHYMAQPDTNVRQTRKELTAKRLVAGPALVLLDRLAQHGTVLHPDPVALKAWIQSRIPLKNWIPAAVEAYEAQTLDRERLRTHLDEVDLNAGSGYRRFFDEAFDAQHASPEGLDTILGLATLRMRYYWAEQQFHHPKPAWSEAQVARLVESLDTPITSAGGHGTLDYVKDLWWGVGCGCYETGLRLLQARNWPLTADYLHHLWEGSARPYAGPQGNQMLGPTDAAFIEEMCALTDRWWHAQNTATHADWKSAHLERALGGVFYRPAGPASVPRLHLIETRLGKGASSGLDRVDLAEQISTLWSGGTYSRSALLLEALDQYLAESAERWQADPNAWAAREALIETIGRDQLTRVHHYARQRTLRERPAALAIRARARS